MGPPGELTLESVLCSNEPLNEPNAKNLFRSLMDSFMDQLSQRCNSCFFYMNSIKLEDIQHINNNFERYGIHICLRTSDCPGDRISCNLEEVFHMPKDLPLEEYKVVVESGGKRHEMNFEFIRRTLSFTCKTGSPFRL